MTTVPDAGAVVPAQAHTPTALDLFMFSASAWPLHRIHYDAAFTTEHEGHPGLFIHGPLLGIYLTQTAEAYLADGASGQSMTYRHHAPAYLGDELECDGIVTGSDSEGVDLELWAQKQDGTSPTAGKARFALR